MQCTKSEIAAATEFEFIRALSEREPGQCLGPLVTVSLSGFRLVALEEALLAPLAVDLLWAGYRPPDTSCGLAFRLCAAHWFDLSYTAGINARQHLREDWFDTADDLLRRTLACAGWDAKEIANMVNWRRLSLT